MPIHDLANCSNDELDVCLGAFSWAILFVAACFVAPALVLLSELLPFVFVAVAGPDLLLLVVEFPCAKTGLSPPILRSYPVRTGNVQQQRARHEQTSACIARHLAMEFISRKVVNVLDVKQKTSHGGGLLIVSVLIQIRT